MSCPTCTFESKNDICELCGTILVYQCESCLTINSINTIECKMCFSHRKHCDCKICTTKKEFKNNYHDYANEHKIDHDEKKLDKHLSYVFKSFLPFLKNYLYTFVNMIQFVIQNRMKDDNEIKERLYYIQNIILPVTKSILNEYYDTSEIEENIIEELTLNEDPKTEPITENVLNKIKKIKKQNKNHTCFCGDEENKNNVITIPCCNTDMHSECLEKWLKIKNTCPFCNKKYTNVNQI